MPPHHPCPCERPYRRHEKPGGVTCRLCNGQPDTFQRIGVAADRLRRELEDGLREHDR
jgi:hypothetical protein